MKGRNVNVPTELSTNFSKETHHIMLYICIKSDFYCIFVHLKAPTEHLDYK